jgi:hypothetical protein
MEEDEGDGDEEGEPGLIERDDHNHHEEVEMHLDQAARHVHEHPGRRDEPHRRERGAPVAAQALDAGAGGEGGDERDLRQRVEDAVPFGDSDEEERRDVDPRQGDDRSMPTFP